MPVRVEKTQADRISECMAILRKLTEEVGVPGKNPSIRILKKRMAKYWRDGLLQEDALPLYGYDRIIHYRLPRWAHQTIEVTLKVSKIMNPPLPSDLVEELQAGTNSATQSGPSHPSPPESAEKSPFPCDRTGHNDQSGECSSPCPQTEAYQS